ncbi:winged helix-turn-helix transcriptional regulator [Motilibacter deserti]|uniref:Helix-turn-helix transcriptional regulator n=1 Tax=Motilibacter deserti TaxID=2714956 RepID=A0ABX0GQQ0_9ACTN|nr:helix-turn-helix transcriptional regulator [Motilibacter deserti]
METEECYDPFQPNCPSRLILSRIGDRWTVLVILALRHEVLRFSELRTKIGSPAPKVLSQTLQALVRDGLVSRQAYAEVPPRVEYRLTDLGRTLLEPIDAVRRWAAVHTGDVLDARERADELVASGAGGADR